MIAGARLNADILEIVSEFLADVPDVLSFALTHTSTYHIATQRLLSMRPICLTRGKSIGKFHSYLFADPLARTPHVRALDIEKPPFSPLPAAQPGDSSLLVDILTSCQNIEQVSISLGGEDKDRLISDLHVVHAIIALKKLRSLSIDVRQRGDIALLRELCVPLRMLRLGRYYDRFLGVDFWYPATLENFLPHHAPTLEKLELDYLIVDPESIKERLPTMSIPSVFSMTQYPVLRSLSVIRLEGAPLLDHLQYLFPTLDDTLSIQGPVFHMDASHDSIRAINQRVQEDSSRTWKKLNRLVCEPLMLHVLGLRCPIQHILLLPSRVSLMASAVDALRENPVSRLTLTLHLAPYTLHGVLSPELSATLTHLTLCVMRDFDGFDPVDAIADCGLPGWKDILDAIVSSLRPLHKLTHFRMVVHFSVNDRRLDWSDDSDDPASPIARAKVHLRSSCGPGFDFAGTAAAFVCSLPCLRYIFVATNGRLLNWDDARCKWEEHERWHLACAWRVEELGEGEPGLVELHDDVANTIIRKEDLVLSEANTVRVQVGSSCL